MAARMQQLSIDRATAVVEAGVKAVESGVRLAIDYMEKPALYG